MEDELLLTKEKQAMAAENLTNSPAIELMEAIEENTLQQDEKQKEAVSDANTELLETGKMEASAEIVVPAEEIAETEDQKLEAHPLEKNLEEQLTAAIEALERNLEETIKEGLKDQRPEAVHGIVKDEALEDVAENLIEPDPRVGKVRATPAARRIAREFKVQLEKVTGSGPDGRIEVDDVKKQIVIQPGTFDYKSKEPVVIGTSLDKIAGNPRNLFSMPEKLEEIPDKKPKSRKKLKDMNKKITKQPNPKLDFVPFFDPDDKSVAEKDVDVVTKISELDFVPFVDFKAEPLREEIIVKPTPMHLIRENELEDLGVKSKESHGLSRKKQVRQQKTEVRVKNTDLSRTNESADCAIKTAESIAIDVEKLVSEPMVLATEQITERDEVPQAPAEKRIEITKEPLQEPEQAVNEETSHEEKKRSFGVRSKTVRKYRIKSNRQTSAISLTAEVDMTEIKELRKKITKKIEEQAKYRCTYTDFLLLATSRALVKHPLLNASQEDDIVRVEDYVNIGLTVECDHGIIVPVIKNAQMMNFVEIVKSRGNLLKAVKNKHLPQDQLEGSTFTITNLGMYGIREFTAIINQNNSAILSVGEVVQRIRIYQGEAVVRSVMKISLNLDQRVANSIDGAKFLQQIKADMENPSLLLF